MKPSAALDAIADAVLRYRPKPKTKPARRRIIGEDEPILMLEVVNRSPELDGSFKHYWLRVPPTIKTAHAAVAWTFEKTTKTYMPLQET